MNAAVRVVREAKRLRGEPRVRRGERDQPRERIVNVAFRPRAIRPRGQPPERVVAQPDVVCALRGVRDRAERFARAVVGVGGDKAIAISPRADPPHRVVPGVLNGVPAGVGDLQQLAADVVLIRGRVAVAVGHRLHPVRAIVGVADRIRRVPGDGEKLAFFAVSRVNRLDDGATFVERGFADQRPADEGATGIKNSNSTGVLTPSTPGAGRKQSV